jgi:predicted S18 family serine protease
MKGKSSIYIVTIFFFSMLSLVLVSGCAKPPQQEMDAANAAIQSAIGAGAETYAADQLKEAQDLIAQMNSQVEKKDYKAAKETAIQAREKALEAKGTAEANKAKAKEDSQNASNEIKDGLEKTKGLLSEAETAGLPAIDLNPIKEQLTAVETAVGELDGMMTGEKYKEAIEKTMQLKEQLAQIEQGITDAKAKFEAAKAAKKKGKKRKE